METQRQAKPDIRLDLEDFDDETIRHTAAFLLGGVQLCKRNEHNDPRNAKVGKLLLSLAVLIGYHLPDPEPTPAEKAGLN